MEYVAHARKRKKHPAHEEHRCRVEKMLNSTYGAAFRQDIRYDPSQSGETVLNPVDFDRLDLLKWQNSLTNNDLLAIMRNLSNGKINMTAPTLIKKFQGKTSFTAEEILLLSEALSLSDEDILDIFNLRPPRHNNPENP